MWSVIILPGTAADSEPMLVTLMQHRLLFIFTLLTVFEKDLGFIPLQTPHPLSGHAGSWASPRLGPGRERLCGPLAILKSSRALITPAFLLAASPCFLLRAAVSVV